MTEPTRHRPADERRSEAVETVIELCAEQEPAAITTGAIAQRMKLSQAALFRHFPTKQAVWQAVAGWVAEQLISRVAAVAEGQTSPLAGLEAMFLAHVAFIAEHPGVPRVMLGELQKPAQGPARRVIAQALATYRARIETLLRDGQACGELRADLDVSGAAVLFAGAIQGLVVQALVSGNMAHARAHAPGVFALYRRGIAA
ncbi:MAG: TetR family transcriptional regulator [Chromatiales bacterium]|nr:TetR family transcriptional regulator [Chromatiales bacterium]